MNSASSDPAVLVEGVTKSFGEVRALRGIDLSVPRGTVLGLLGPNGAGKTSAVRILTTLLPPDGGHALVEGYDVVTQAAEVRLLIGLAGQSAAVHGQLTGRENLEIVGRLLHLPRSRARARAEELLAQFELAEASERHASSYSGGMLSRLDLAASLVGEPRVLFLDEPTTGLDPRSRLDLWGVIRQLAAHGTTVLLTTQYMEEADYLADQIVVIDHGLVIAAGTVAELKGRVGGDVLEFAVPDRSLLAAAVTAVAALSAAEPHVDREAVTVRLPVGGRGSDALVEAVRRLDAAGVPVDGLTVRKPSLDDVFLALTGQPVNEEAPPGRSRRRDRRPRRAAPSPGQPNGTEAMSATKGRT